ncbi:MAG TPA: phosphatidylglycerophosphatase A [Polyangiaceae bacterium]|nr:phosphatidylglycerophosphatase A [Polyangiaceae bacterium]
MARVVPEPLAIRLIATWFGCGSSPRAPGTVGSLGAVPLHLLLSEAPPVLHAFGILLTLAAGTWAAHRYATERAQSDPQSVVIDEVIGTLLAMGAVRHQAIWLQGLALLLFRLFDIWKPGPIRRAEHLSPVGVGIMADDVLAGLCAGALAWGAARLL